MKSTFHKHHPKILNYRNYKLFNNDNFRTDLLYAIKQMGPQNIGCEQFEHLFMNTFNKHAPQKKQICQGK